MAKSFFSIAFILTAFLTYGQPMSKTEIEIRRLEQSVVTAILKGDTNTLKQVWAPEFLVNNPRNEISINRDAVFMAQRSGLIDYSSFERIIEQMQFQKNIVITMGYETFVSRRDFPGTMAGQTYKRRFTNIWMKKKGKWQQIARHASVICVGIN